MVNKRRDNTSDYRTSTPSLHGFVDLGTGWRQPAEDFGPYAEAFHKAAKQLTDVFAHDPSYDVLDVCPIVFLYRHATELYLKGVLRAGEFLLKLRGQKPTFDASSFTSHPLKPLLGPLRELFLAMDWSESYEEIASFVESLDKMDPNSFAFRYPVDKEDIGALPEYCGFNVLSFARAADSSLHLLYNASYTIDDRTEMTKENLENL